jgi:membrane-bound lytic murein transglycosylase D
MLNKHLISGIILSLIACSININLNAQSPESAASDYEEPKTEETFIIPDDDPIVAMLDSLALLTVFRNIEKRTDTTLIINNFPFGFVPQYSDSIYHARISQMDAYSPIEFVFNPYVKSFINLYANRRRELTERVLGLAELYFPLFEEELDKHNLPLELKYLAVIESALNPVARSRVGATGLWQFMYGTGKMYGLQVNSYVDDRSDVIRSTIAACEHFIDLYNIYNDWALVLSAYNAGPGNVNRAIRRAGGVKDFWKIRPYLPRETQNYFPAFIAVAYVMEHAREHNLYPSPPVYTGLDVDTIIVRQQLSLRVIGDLLDVPLDHLRYLNPAFRLNVIPHNAKNPYVLRIPRDYTGKFIALEDSIYNYRSQEQIRQDELAAQMQETTTYVVRSGDVLGSIARRHGTTVGEIQRLNNIRGTTIRPGQRLIVRAPARPSTQLASNANTHVVKTGETLGVIAGRYRVSVNDIRQWNNLSGTTILAGQNLIVRKPENFVSSAVEVVEVVEQEETVPEESQVEYIYYTVEKGDTLYDIASRYEHISIEELKELNNIESGVSLEPGQVLKISSIK